MFVVSRNIRESVVIGQFDGLATSLKVTVLETRGGRVRLGFEVVSDDGSGSRPPDTKSNIAVHRTPPKRSNTPSGDAFDRWADDGGEVESVQTRRLLNRDKTRTKQHREST